MVEIPLKIGLLNERKRVKFQSFFKSSVLILLKQKMRFWGKIEGFFEWEG